MYMAYPERDCIVSLRGISKRFSEPLTNPFRKRKSLQALSSVDMDIPTGKVTCLLGPNGAGKTTLIKILSCLITPDEGEVRFRGAVVSGDGKAIQGSIGLVTPNERSFYWRLTGRENLNFFGSLYGLRGRALAQRVEGALGESGMSESADKPYRLYSAGMKQKLNIARALLGSPELFLLDEPAAHLDPLAREDFRKFIREVLIDKRGATVFLCTHDLEEARHLADLVAVLDAGQVVAMGHIGELGSLLDNRREIVLRYSGELPADWVSGWGDAILFDGPGTVRLLFDGDRVRQERIIRDFILAGGELREAFADQDDLLRLLRRKVGNR